MVPTVAPPEFVLQSSLRVHGSVVFDLDSGIIFGPRDQISAFVSESESGLQFNASVSIDDEEEGNILGLSSILKYDGSRIYDVDSGMSLRPDIGVEVFANEHESDFHFDAGIGIDADGDTYGFEVTSMLKTDGAKAFDVTFNVTFEHGIEVGMFLDEVESGYHLDMDLAIDVDGDYPSFNTALNSFGPYDVDQTCNASYYKLHMSDAYGDGWNGCKVLCVACG